MPGPAKKTILFLAADPTDVSRIRVGKEFREIQAKLRSARLRDEFALEIRTAVRPEDVTQALLDVQAEIVHFAGHGTLAGELCFEDDSGRTKTVSPRVLERLFRLFSKKVDCVILNTCYSQVQAEAIVKHIGHVVGTNQALGDEKAIAFATGFYAGLGGGLSIEEAYGYGLVYADLNETQERQVHILLRKVEPALAKRATERPSAVGSAVPSGLHVRGKLQPVGEREGPEFRYSNLFQIASLRLPYIVILGGWQQNANEFGQGDVEAKWDEDSVFALPADFRVNRQLYPHKERGSRAEPKCRLVRYNCEIIPGDPPNRLGFEFSKVSYLDYLMSGEHLDDPLPADSTQTFRGKYAPRLDETALKEFPLSNICGVGIFVITRDDKIIVSRSSPHVSVYSNVWSYTGAGTMDWDKREDPFVAVQRECDEEINHVPNLDDTYLFGFGVDAKRLYFQFSFFEHTGLLANEILALALLARDRSEISRLEAIPFDLDFVVALVKSQEWEPAAAVSLLTLCTKRFGLRRVEEAIEPGFVRKALRGEMIAEWDFRAARPGEMAVMSARYPFDRCTEESERYVNAALDFMGADVEGKDVLELGAGIGRLSEHLVDRAGRLTCLDLSEGMLERNRERLGGRARQVEYHNVFAQDYRPKRRHDVVISSLVLIHNTDDESFGHLCEVIAACADIIFLFEHVDVAYQVSTYTRPRGEKELLSAFHGYRVGRKAEYRLFNDKIVFLKLVC